jgi:two-component system cell cycle sensor histidine kinase/response regulator CckA
MLFPSMKTKMTFMVFSLVLVLIATIGGITFVYCEKTIKGIISDQQFTLVTAVADQIDNKIHDALINLETLADIIAPATVADPGKARRFLDVQKDEREFFNGKLFLYSEAGGLIAATPGKLDSSYQADAVRAYVGKTLQTRKPAISGPFTSLQESRHPIIVFTVPVFDARKKMIAVLGGSVNLREQRYLGQMADIKLGKGGYLSLYDKNRVIIVHPKKRLILEKAPEGANRLLDKALAGFEGTEETATPSGRHILRSVKRLKSADWVLAATYPLAEAYTPLYLARKYFLIGGIAAVLLSALLVWSAMKYLTAPLMSFTRHIKALSSGEEGKHLVPITADDEIGTLAQAFNNMLLELDRQKTELHQSEERYRLLADNATNVIWTMDLGGRFTYFSPSVERHWGYTADEALNLSLERLLTPASAVLAQNKFNKAVTVVNAGRRMQGGYFELEIIHKDGSTWWADVTYGGMYSASGEFVSFIGSTRDITERKEAERELERLAREDALSGLANRRHFDELLDIEVRRASRNGDYLSLLLCDVDFFKRFNDHYGHLAGDACLQTMGRVLRHVFRRAGEIPARYGGEEFAVILPGTAPENAALMAETLRQEMIAEAIPHARSDVADCVTVSIGVVGARVSTDRTAVWFTHEADTALYQSKKDGRNRVTSVSFD